MTQKFLDHPPEGFDATMELKWIKCSTGTPLRSLLHTTVQETNSECVYGDCFVLCQKWTGAFRDAWVRVPTEE